MWWEGVFQFLVILLALAATGLCIDQDILACKWQVKYKKNSLTRFFRSQDPNMNTCCKVHKNWSQKISWRIMG